MARCQDRRGGLRREFFQTSGYDPSRAGYGSGPLGGAFNAGLIVPKFIPAGNARFLLRLAAAQVAPGERVSLACYRLRATIAQVQELPLPLRSNYPIEREIVSQFWSFIDGNILYFFLIEPITSQANPGGPSATAGPSTQFGFDGTDSALLYAQYDPGASTYVPPNGGKPTGKEIAGLSSLPDIGGQWTDTFHVGHVIEGPCKVVLYASVLQTNPATRPFLPAAQQPNPAYATGLRPEDQFLFGWGDSFPTNNVQYNRVFGAFALDYHEDE